MYIRAVEQTQRTNLDHNPIFGPSHDEGQLIGIGVADMN
jgi:hypothetical protein